MSTDWFKEKCWSISANKEGLLQKCKPSTSTTVVYPESSQDISSLLKSNLEAAVAVVCGGHSSSNAAAWAYFSVAEDEQDRDKNSTIILDMKNMSSIAVDREAGEVTVGGGSNFRCRIGNGSYYIAHFQDGS